MLQYVLLLVISAFSIKLRRLVVKSATNVSTVGTAKHTRIMIVIELVSIKEEGQARYH